MQTPFDQLDIGGALSEVMASGMRPELAAPLLEGRSWDYFAYSPAPFLALAAAATATATIAIEADSAFLAMAGVACTNLTATPQTILTPVAALVQIADGGAGRLVFDQPQHAANVFGTGAQPCPWTFYRWFKPNSAVRFTVTSRLAAAGDFFFAMIGVKLYRGTQGEGF